MLVSSYINSLFSFLLKKNVSPLQRVQATISVLATLVFQTAEKENLCFLTVSLLVKGVEVIAAEGMTALHSGELPRQMDKIFTLRGYLESTTDSDINTPYTNTNTNINTNTNTDINSNNNNNYNNSNNNNNGSSKSNNDSLSINNKKEVAFPLRNWSVWKAKVDNYFEYLDKVTSVNRPFCGSIAHVFTGFFVLYLFPLDM